jgi:hypothetical protein
MSMNINITATREIQVVKTGKVDQQSIRFDCWQTPTKHSYDIANSDDSIQAYKEWVRVEREPYEVDQYAEDDIWNEREPIGKAIYNPAQEHIEELDCWLKQVEAEGYVVKVVVW